MAEGLDCGDLAGECPRGSEKANKVLSLVKYLYIYQAICYCATISANPFSLRYDRLACRQKATESG